MGKTAILAVRIIGDAVGAVRAMGQVDRSAIAMERSMSLARLGAVLLFGALVAGGIQVEQVASDLQQASGAVDSVFGAYAEGVHGLADTAAQEVGLAEDQYSQLASVLGSQLNNLGVAQDELGVKTDELIKLGADLSATYGGTAADAVAALSSLLRGERDPIERYGVSIKQSDIEARKAALGLDKLTGEAQKNADLQVTLAILTEQTGAAHGKFAAEADTAAGAQQRANAAWRDAQAELGVALLPFVVAGAKAMSEFAHWVGENQQLVQVLVVILGGLALAVIALTAAQWAFNIAAIANPIGLIVIAIALAIGVLVAIVILVIQHWEEIERVGQEAFVNVGNAVGEVALQVQNFTNDIIDAINWLIKLGSGEFLSDSIAHLFGLEGADFAPQLSHVDIVSKNPTQAPVVTTTNNITVNGAVDVEGTSRKIQEIMTSAGKNSGSIAAAGVTT